MTEIRRFTIRQSAPASSPGPRLYWLPRSILARVLLLGLFALSVRAQFAGYSSYTPVLFGQMYIAIFTAAFVLLPIQVTRDVPSFTVFVFGPAGLVAWAFASRFAPRMGEPNYCGGMMGFMALSPRVPPHVFRCTSFPYGMAAFILVWWAACATLDRWTKSRT